MPLLTDPRPTYRHCWGDIFEMAEDMGYQDNDTDQIYFVREGFKWNKASIIKLVPRAFVPHGDEFTYPSAVHDQFYNDKSVSRGTADRVMRQFLIEEFDYSRKMQGKQGKARIGRLKAWTAWAAVRANLYAAYHW